MASRLAIFFLACAILVLLRPILLDPDYYWHLETGRLIYEQRALPTTDSFAYTYAGQPWVLHEWLFQIVLFVLYDWFGVLGVKILTVGAATGTLGVVYATARRLGCRHVWAIVVVFLLLVLLLSFISPRPQVFSFLLFAFTLQALLLAKFNGERRWLNWLPPAMALWVNLHGAYAVGLAVILAFVALELVQAWMDAAIATRRSYLRQLLLIALLSLLASFLNPEGPRHLLYPFETVGLAATADIVEWQPPNVREPIGKLYLLTVGAFVLLLVYRRKKPDLTEFILPGIMIVAGFTSVRHIPFAALVMAMLASHSPLAEAPWLGRLLQPLRDWRRRRQAAPKGAQIGAMEIPLNFLACIALIVGGAIYYAKASAREAEALARWQPVGAVEFMTANGVTGRMFNSLHFGGYLIHRLRGHPQVFIDGRTDMFGDRFFAEYLTLNFAREGWDRLLEKYGIDLVITTPSAQISKTLLLQGSFAQVYKDDACVILLRRNPENADLIQKFGQ